MLVSHLLMNVSMELWGFFVVVLYHLLLYLRVPT